MILAPDTLTFPEADAEKLQRLPNTLSAPPWDKDESVMKYTNKATAEQTDIERLLPGLQTRTCRASCYSEVLG